MLNGVEIHLNLRAIEDPKDVICANIDLLVAEED